ncbi:MAG TPA: response regulator, partial [Chthoniobacteraceae bacterium]|nr:response regulator [Chthoniobacteraceae bacterium]
MAEEYIRVLLVEDNEEHAELLQRMLIDSDNPIFEVAKFSALRPALDALDLPGFQAVLLDLTLPDSEGIQTFLRMQAAAPDLPIVVLTGLDDEALAVETVQRGAQDYLVKGRVD